VGRTLVQEGAHSLVCDRGSNHWEGMGRGVGVEDAIGFEAVVERGGQVGHIAWGGKVGGFWWWAAVAGAVKSWEGGAVMHATLYKARQWGWCMGVLAG
jgi:hypothetical protein